ncbi:putative E3 ubiquitin-protein ligase RNF14 [Triangularia setosa]|uniref:RBR-type E3 ubiquitin transferase n=1 Tax=Triangularia setosa TaxID=2587417 RepID=A0AAN6W607_9PEZI|nr:putative E3 ubiquitin-protein ligase RNF14 [Podospora setosa]
MPEEQDLPHLELRGGRSRSNSSPAGGGGFLSRFFRPHQQQNQHSNHHSHRHHHHHDESPPPHHHHHHTKDKDINPNPDNDHVHNIPPKPSKPPPNRHQHLRNPFFRPRAPKPKQKKSSDIGTRAKRSLSSRPGGSRVSTAAEKKQKARLALDIKPLLDSNPSFARISFQFRSSGLSAARVVKFIKEELKGSHDGVVVKLFDTSGKRLGPGDLIPGTRPSTKPTTIWYRLLSDPASNEEKWQFSSCVKSDQREKLNAMISSGATVGEIRKTVAGLLGVKEERRIRLYADDGIFHGFLQGEGWVLQEIGKRWLTRYLAVHVRNREGWVEVKLKGWGNDGAGRRYVIHPGSGESKWTVRDLKVNLITGGLVNVQERRKRSGLSRKGLLISGGLRMRLDGKRVGDSEGVVWGASYEFEFGGVEDAEVFAGEENWLLKPTESCDICVEEKGVTEFPVRIASGGCKGHKPPLCKDCLGRWLVESMEAGKWRRLKCPDTECAAVLQHHDVKRYAEKEMFERYDRWLLRDALEGMKGYVQCVTVGCEYGCMVGDQEACPTFHCRKCKGSHCIKHGVAHPGETCKQYRKRQKDRKEQEEASEREVAGMAKDCPKCGRRVNKTAGCNHITCHCGHEWCYVCMASYFHAQGTGLLLCRHNKGCTEGPLPGAELFNDDGTLRDPVGQRFPPRPFFHRPVIPDVAPQGAGWLFPHFQRRNRPPGAAAAGEEPLPPGPEPGARNPPMMTGANPGLVRPGPPPPWVPGMGGARPRARGTGTEAARRARGLDFHA